MPDLSPQAQAILTAFDNRYELCGPFDEDWQELCLAATLRAAAQAMPVQELTREPPDEFEQGLSQGQSLAREELLAWAEELEGNTLPAY